MTARPSPVELALKGRCPRCGVGPLFDGIVKFAPRCRACGLDIAGFNVGDGPAAFLIFIVGAIVTGLAIWVELAATPPWWVHLVWVPVTLALTLGGLRAGKAWLVAEEYRHAAREGRISE